jgi:hypothetical protein
VVVKRKAKAVSADREPLVRAAFFIRGGRMSYDRRRDCKWLDGQNCQWFKYHPEWHRYPRWKEVRGIVTDCTDCPCFEKEEENEECVETVPDGGGALGDEEAVPE